jgi:thiamine biosynthesis lipoprotein
VPYLLSPALCGAFFCLFNISHYFHPMNRLLYIFFLIALVSITSFRHHQSISSPLKVFSISGFAQGTSYHIRYSGEYPLLNKADIDSLLNKLDSSLSLYKSYSLINQFNHSRSGIIADDHFSNVVNKAVEISEKTNGSFDITIKPLLSLWGFYNNKRSRIPTLGEINKIKMHVGYQKLKWEGARLMKDDPLIQLECDGIAQGYSVDQIASYMNHLGIHNYQIELGGEVFVKGKMPQDVFWKTGLDILHANANPREHQLLLENEAVTTSGSFSKFSKIGNSYFGHILDPEEGRPVDNGIISVSVIAQDAITADAYDNAFMVMGVMKSMRYVQDKTKTGLYIIYRTRNGVIKDTANPYFKTKISPFAEASPHSR